MYIFVILKIFCQFINHHKKICYIREFYLLITKIMAKKVCLSVRKEVVLYAKET